MSTTILPDESPSATPSGPKSTSSTSGVSGTMVMMTSAPRATSRPLEQATAPLSISSFGGVRDGVDEELVPAGEQMAGHGACP